MKRRCFEGYLEYLQERGGRYLKTGRPDPWHRFNQRITYEPPNPSRKDPHDQEHIAIMCYSTPVVKHFRNGDIRIYAGNWLTRATAECIKDHTNLSMWLHKGNWFVSTRYHSGLMSDNRDNCTYWFSAPDPVYDQWGPPSLNDKTARGFGSTSAYIYKDPHRIIRSTAGFALLSVARKKEIDEMLKARKRAAGKHRSKQRARFTYYLRALLKDASEADRVEFWREWGLEYSHRTDRLGYELELAQSKLQGASRANSELAYAVMQLRRKAQEYQNRLAGWDLLSMPEQQPEQHDRSRIVIVGEEVP